MSSLLFILIILLFSIVVGFFGGGMLLVWITKLFRIEKPSYKKSLIVLIVSGLAGFIAGIIFGIVNLGILSNLLVSVVSFFVFHHFYKKYYQSSWKKSLGIYIVSGIIGTVVVLLIVIPIRLYVFSPFVVSGEAMSPTYNNGAYLIIDKFDKSFERGNVVVFDTSFIKGYEGQTFIKRIVGLPLEKVEIKDGKVSINGQVLNESYVSGDTSGDTSITLNQNEYFVLGDNRSKSFDSRMWGPLNKSNIEGKVSK
jgi:signal peptidase I